MFFSISVGAIKGIRTEKQYKPVLKDLFSIEKVVPWAFEKLGYDVFADLKERKVSQIPSNYGLITKEERLEFVNGANLKGKNLNYSDMSKAFLIKADLRNASLENAILTETNFQQANLQEAHLDEANLQKAYLGEANLQKAHLEEASLQEAFLGDANLQKAYLEGANLQEANFHSADLIGAKNLTIEQLSKVKTLYQAKLDPELLKQVKKCCPHLLDKPKEEKDEKK